MALLCCVISDALGRNVFCQQPCSSGLWLEIVSLCLDWNCVLLRVRVYLCVWCVFGPPRLPRPLFDSMLSLGKQNGLITMSAIFTEGTLCRLSIGPNASWLWSLPIHVNHTCLRTDSVLHGSRLYSSSMRERKMTSYGDTLYSRNVVYGTNEAVPFTAAENCELRLSGLMARFCALLQGKALKGPLLKHILPGMSTSWCWFTSVRRWVNEAPLFIV